MQGSLSSPSKERLQCSQESRDTASVGFGIRSCAGISLMNRAKEMCWVRFIRPRLCAASSRLSCEASVDQDLISVCNSVKPREEQFCFSRVTSPSLESSADLTAQVPSNTQSSHCSAKLMPGAWRGPQGGWVQFEDRFQLSLDWSQGSPFRGLLLAGCSSRALRASICFKGKDHVPALGEVWGHAGL